MEKNKKELLRFSKLSFYTGCIGFGGGSALIPVLEKAFVKEHPYDTHDHFEKSVVVASITPGALPVELVSAIGKKKFGIPGMLLGAMALTVPGAIGTIVLLHTFMSMSSDMLHVIRLFSVIAGAFILSVLARYILSVLKGSGAEHKMWKKLFVMLMTFVLTSGRKILAVFGMEWLLPIQVSAVHVMIAALFFVIYTESVYSLQRVLPSGIVIFLYLLTHGKSLLTGMTVLSDIVGMVMLLLALYRVWQMLRTDDNSFQLDRKQLRRDTMTWLCFLILLSLPAVLLFQDAVFFTGKGILSALLSFGGGDAYLTVANSLFVEDGMISSELFYGQIVPVVNILPGSILCKTLTGTGYLVGLSQDGMMGAVLYALMGFAVSIASSCGCFFACYHLYDCFGDFKVIQIFGRWIRPIVCGLLGNVVISILMQGQSSLEYFGVSGMGSVLCMIGSAVFMSCLQHRKKAA